MTIWWLILILAAIGSAGIAFIWIIVRLGAPARGGKSLPDSIEEAAKQDIEHIFGDDFREELRNRGRLHFEKIISDNAMFLQQDLRLTTSQVNEYMKDEITRKLQEEFQKYERSILDAKELAVESIQKTNQAIDEQRKQLSEQTRQEITAEKELILKRFEDNMAEIINHYVLDAIGNQIDLNDQLEYILGDLEEHKQAIMEDVRNGA